MQSEPGAPPARGAIPLCVPELRGKEWSYIKECLDTNWVSSAGPFVNRFEQAIAALVGARYAVATVNGTAALHIALLIAGVEPDDEVLVPTLTFIAPANAIRYVGAWPVFIDAEPDHWQMNPQEVARFIRMECTWRRGELHNKATHRRVKAILPVHILGHPVDMDPLLELARDYKLAVIEDATESLGARYKAKMVGRLGDSACFSFNGNKIITTGGGGMIVTDDVEWAEKARYLTTQAKDDPIEYIHGAVGYNYRLSNLQAAMGVAQLEQIDDFVAAKRRIGAKYAEALADVPGVKPMAEAAWAFSSFWLSTILVDEAEYGMDSRALLRRLGERGIQARPLWQPLHQSPAHRGSLGGPCAVADRLNRQALSLPSSVGLTDKELETVATVIKEGTGRTGR